MIGGSDKVLWVDEKPPAAELILRAVRHHWPTFVFQNAEDEQPIAAAQTSGLPQPSGREFFVYRDKEAAQHWLQAGATDDNKKTMIHVLLGDRRKPELALRSVTLVGDDWMGELAAILVAIQTAFEGFTKNTPAAGQAPTAGPVQHAAKRQ